MRGTIYNAKIINLIPFCRLTILIFLAENVGLAIGLTLFQFFFSINKRPVIRLALLRSSRLKPASFYRVQELVTKKFHLVYWSLGKVIKLFNSDLLYHIRIKYDNVRLSTNIKSIQCKESLYIQKLLLFIFDCKPNPCINGPNQMHNSIRLSLWGCDVQHTYPKTLPNLCIHPSTMTMSLPPYVMRNLKELYM